MTKSFERERFVGIALSGSKNNKTVIVSVDFYPENSKFFVSSIIEKQGSSKTQTADERLLTTISRLDREISLDPLTKQTKEAFNHGSEQTNIRLIKTIAFNVPLDLPPCVTCNILRCPTPKQCEVPSTEYMRKLSESSNAAKVSKMGAYSPYTERPAEVWVKQKVMPELDELFDFEIDEALGGNKAPLTVRAQYLVRHLGRQFSLIETWPKLSVARLLDKKQSREFKRHRELQSGITARSKILEILSERDGLFIYSADQKLITESLAIFDAFICAYTAFLARVGLTVERPKTFPLQATFVTYPK